MRSVGLRTSWTLGVGFALVCVLALGPESRAAAESFRVQFAFGSPGSAPGELNVPYGIAVDRAGRIVVADALNHRVQVFNDQGKHLFAFGSSGSGRGQFAEPHGVAVDASGRIVVTDTLNSRVQVFDDKGKFLFTFGTPGSGPGQLAKPEGVAVDRRRRIVVVDQGNARVQLFDANGKFLLAFGSAGKEPGQFNAPTGVAVDAAGRIYVADSFNNRVQLFDPRGRPVTMFGTSGAGPGQLYAPYGVAVDAVGRIIVADANNSRIQIFDARGASFARFGGPGAGPGEFTAPFGVALDQAGRIIAADAFNHRIQVFGPTPAVAAPAPPPTAPAAPPAAPVAPVPAAAPVAAASATPASDAAPSPPPNAKGWNNTDVTVTLHATDNPNGSGVKEIQYSLAGAQAGGAVVSGSVASVMITAEGTTTLVYFARDNAGNQQAPRTLTIRIDKTPPGLACSPSPAANANGWNNTNVTVNFSATDALSGIDTPPAPVALATEGANQIVTRSVLDNAGNSASTTCRVSIDKTPPTLTFGAATPAPNVNGWNNTNVSIPFRASDALSGVATTEPGGSALVLATEGPVVTGTVSITDRAGNSVAFTSPAVKLDKTPPTLSFGAPSPAPNLAGWHNTDVSISFTAADNLSGVASTSPASPLILTDEAAAVIGTVVVTDAAGNSATFTTPAVKIDKTAPGTTVGPPPGRR
ncbi:MAG: 6-bladed beta-propeller [Candidatus Rokubacteria bacterium]|nr:6-bladed beta-propeller [Candidatus Rokubacteria bacterium]